MKKIIICSIISFIFCGNNIAEARYCHSHSYVTHRDFYQEDIAFPNCNKHSMLKETTVYFYSNGTRSTYTISTIFNSDGSVLESGCSNVKHLIYNNKHYFTFYKNKRYQILDENGKYLSVKNYKKMKEIAPNRLLVKLDKKFGVIDLNENTITPPKYKKFEEVGKNLYLTKLNGYYGMIDSNNNVLIKNEHDKIAPLYETFVLKKYNKYGLVDKNGKRILNTEYDKIKKLGEYILVEKDNLFGIYDSSGKKLTDIKYKKIRLERNSLEGKLPKNSWETLEFI